MELAAIRHQLHQLAEPSGAEILTQQFLLQQLSSLHPTEIHTFTNSKNLLAVFDSGIAGPVVLLRGDFDAVCVAETLDLPYASRTEGVSHKCGHDGHAAILLGVAQKLSQHPVAAGKVLLFFQAAEETGAGAGLLLETGILDRHRPDRVFALHNIPGIPLGTVTCREESFTCSVVSCDIVLRGRTSHAAEPLKAVCPYNAAKCIADQLLSMNRYDMSRADFCLLTLVEFSVGECAYGVTAGNGVLRFTLRAKDDRVLQKTKADLLRIVEVEVAKIDGLSSEVAWKEYFAASKNQRDAVQQVRVAAQKCGLAYTEKEFPFSWGEDFGLLTQHFDGALFGLGSGDNQPSLHNPYFDFPDALLPIGVSLFEAIVRS